MKAFVFKRWQETEIYSWLRLRHPDFCDDLRGQIESLRVTRAGRDDVGSLFDAERIVRQIGLAAERLVLRENPLAKKPGSDADPFAEILAHELRRVDYNAIGWAFYHDLEAVPDALLDALI